MDETSRVAGGPARPSGSSPDLQKEPDYREIVGLYFFKEPHAWALYTVSPLFKGRKKSGFNFRPCKDAGEEVKYASAAGNEQTLSAVIGGSGG